VTTSGGTELSTTESAIHESPARKLDQTSKVNYIKAWKIDVKICGCNLRLKPKYG